MWVTKIPMRPDFCGCPPCPTCFDWTDGEHSPRIEGMVKFFRDLLGDKKPTKKQKAELEKAADAIHVANKAAKTQPPIDVDAGAEEFHAADERQFMHRRLRAIACEREKETARPKVASLPVLDHIDMEKKPAKKKAPQPVSVEETVPNDYFQRQQMEKQMKEELYRRERDMWKYGPSTYANPYSR